MRDSLMGEQDNTAKSFADKWSKNKELAFAETLEENSEIHQWILQRNGFSNQGVLKEHLKSCKRVLDAGCGNGRVSALLRSVTDVETCEVVGIDLVSADVARSNLSGYQNIRFEEKDLLGNLDGLGKFDFIYCQEVLHHTKSPKEAFLNLCGRLNVGGEIAIYVYKKKAVTREFVDDHVRNQISMLDYEQALEVCQQITQLGKNLSELNVEIEVPSIDILGIEEGKYDIQRFIYHFFMKCFWNPKFSFHDNSVINYDWYHPQLCSRHTVDEIRLWFNEANLRIIHENIDPYGITMRGINRTTK